MREALKVGVSGVRGVVGGSLGPRIACSFAQAFGLFVRAGSVVVGRDTRPTGRMLELAVVAGLQAAGCRVLCAGVVPTPTLLHLVRELGAAGGIAVTASHNPAAYNALKFADRRGIFLDAVGCEEFLDVYHQGDFACVPEEAIRAAEAIPSPCEGHLRKVLAYVDAEAVRRARFRVAVDCCNGAGATCTRGFLESLGCEVRAVFERPDGVFERDPEPLPQHIGALCEAVVDGQCQVGFAQDPDADRLAVVDEHGRPIGEDLSVALAVEQVLERHERGPVVVNQSASKAIQRICERLGAACQLAMTGETHVVKSMRESGAVVGGESSGGVIVPAVHPCRDSFIGMALVLERMAQTGRSLSALRESIPRYAVVKRKLPVPAGRSVEVLRALRRAYADRQPDLRDGVYVDLGESWIHVRRSNTEPVLRYLAEAPTEDEAERLSAEIEEKIRAALST
ncbi:MAG: phosphoglucosamine mutase [Deltaproteobacteria bacterium]|nr:phosphoglucosamine mutase [Deltaproteobacteria bacterium]